MKVAFASFLCCAIAAISTPVHGEEVVRIRPGTYNLSQVVTRAGTAANWIRYTPETPGSVVIRGGEQVERPYVILDGLIIDGRLHPDYPARAHGFSVATSNVKIENTQVIGPNQVHSGYNPLNQVDCHEFAGGIPGVGMGGIGSKNLTVFNVIVSGFREAASFKDGAGVRIVSSLFRNNFNGISFAEGEYLELIDSVMWVHPNHQFSIKNTNGGVVRLINNLLADSQDMVKAGQNWEGIDELHIIHNTFWAPANKPCNDYTGLTTSNVRKRLIVRDNVFVNKFQSWMGLQDYQRAITSVDFNVYYHHDLTSKKHFKYNLEDIMEATWKSATGFDGNSIFLQPPAFTMHVDYVLPLRNPGSSSNNWGFHTPKSVSEARGWFYLRPGSPGKDAASDGSDMGIVPTSVSVPDLPALTPAPPKNVRLVG